MKMVLICPGERPALSALTRGKPLVLVPVLGKTVLEHWLEYATCQGFKEVILSVSDSLAQVQGLVGEGGRWGLQVEVRREVREFSLEEAQEKYGVDRVVLMDQVPQLRGQPLFESYAGYMAALQRLMEKQLIPSLIGLKEIRPGVWVGHRSRIASDAQLLAPCWIGENVWIESGAVIGPGAIVENRSYIDRGAAVKDSLVGPDTFVGEGTDILQSLAWGSALVSWRMNSCLLVPDPWLLCGLRERHVVFDGLTWPRQVASWVVLGLSLPMGAAALLKNKLEEVRALRHIGLRD